MFRLLIVTVILMLAVPSAVFCGEADVVGVEVTATGNGTFRFDVTVEHADTGWDHYADKWEVLTAEGTVLGMRTLHHPHVGEQPFTRSLSGVKIPATVAEVTLRAHDSVHAYGGNTQTIKVPH